MGMSEVECIHIRSFERGDMGEILEIESGAFPKTPYPREIFRHYAIVSPNTFAVINKGEKVAGYIIFDSTGHVISMAVKGEHRRKGFGKSLVMYALEQTGARLWLEVRTKNQGAIAFYRNLGMKTVGKIPGYYGNDDALIMAKGKESE
jgi:ribosomal-protein-alanine N-acetyltransferase